MTYSHAKIQGQRSVGSEDRVETNGQTDGGDCITFHANAVGKNIVGPLKCLTEAKANIFYAADDVWLN